MKTLSVTLLGTLCIANLAYGFGGKKMNFTEVRGTSEAQVVQNDGEDAMKVLIRGRAAELLFKVNVAKASELKDTDAMKAMKAKQKSHWAWNGKQIECAKVADEKKHAEEYACGFTLTPKGEVAAFEPFNPVVFNLAQTDQKTTLFKKTKGQGRAIASLAAPALDKATAYVVYDQPREKMNSKEAMVVIRGTAAQEIMNKLAADPKADKFHKGTVEGVRGQEIACVAALGNESERCSFVVSMDDGAVTKSHNPLFK